jgi:hypothetical protein
MNALLKDVERTNQQQGSNHLQRLARQATRVQVRTNENQVKCLMDRAVCGQINQSWETESHMKEFWMLWSPGKIK